ncbi:MAG: hypothetical protein GF398_04030 [Chitinivibrionales bacterium]|nr:hypothetical protein [Chitinivibrionales bacterium]
MSKIMNAFIPALAVSLIVVAGCSAKEKDTNSESSGKPASQAAKQEKTNKADNLTVFYFHTTYRCWTCNQFEKLTKVILRETFAEKLADSSITFRAINIEEEPNRHFVDEYKLVTKSLVLSLRKDGRELEWKNLDKIWQLVRDTQRFNEYVKSAIEEYAQKTS